MRYDADLKRAVLMQKTVAHAKNIMHSAVQMAGFHYIVCLKTIPTNEDGSIKFENTEVVFQNIGQTDNNTLHFDFQRWAAASVLRDLIESFSIFLSEIYSLKIQENPGFSYSITAEKFERLGLEDQLNTFASNFEIDQRYIKTLIGFNRLRNCLAHRQGQVGSKDCNGSNHLIINWISQEVKLSNFEDVKDIEDGGFLTGLLVGKHEFGAASSVQTSLTEKQFPIGTMLALQPKEVFEICSTFQLFTAAFTLV